MVTTFIAVYRGDTVAGARIVALTADPEIVRDLAARLLASPPRRHNEPNSEERRRMIRVVEDEGQEGARTEEPS
jgi:hypothetical protein